MKIEFLGQDTEPRRGIQPTRWYRVMSEDGRTLWGPDTWEGCQRWKRQKADAARKEAAT